MFLDGILTAVTSAPDYDLDVAVEKVSAQLAPTDRDEFETELGLMIGRLEEDMDEGPPTLLPGTEDTAGLQHWLSGYMFGISLDDKRWRALADTYPALDAALTILGSVLDLEDPLGLQGDFGIPAEREEIGQLIPLLVYGIYQGLYARPPAAALSHLEPAALCAADEEQLFQTLITAGATAPRAVIDECAGRGEAMIPLLERHIAAFYPATGLRERSEEEFWGIHHAVLVLGRMTGEDAGDALARAFELIYTRTTDDDLPHLLHYTWKLLFQNKPATTVDSLKPVAEDRTRPPDVRLVAVEVLLAHAASHGGERLEHTLDWVAALCDRKDDDPELRQLAGITLLAFPRQRHRPLFEALGRIDPGPVEIDPLAPENVEEAFNRGDLDEWADSDGAWEGFYADMGAWEHQLPAHGQALELFTRLAPPRLQTRKAPKVGRNDPCPCGSGRKYKKCCLNKS